MTGKYAPPARPLSSLVLDPRRDPAADVALGLVFLQNRLGLGPERAVQLFPTLRDVLVYRGFADAEPSSRGADSAFVFKQIRGQIAGARFDGVSYADHSPGPDPGRTIFCTIYMTRVTGDMRPQEREKWEILNKFTLLFRGFYAIFILANY